MAAVSNRQAHQVLVDLGANQIWLSYSDEDTVATFKDLIKQRTGFSADEQELHAHYQPTHWWNFCCEDVQELDDPNACFKDLMRNVNHISLKVIAKVSLSCNCQYRDLP